MEKGAKTILILVTAFLLIFCIIVLVDLGEKREGDMVETKKLVLDDFGIPRILVEKRVIDKGVPVETTE